MTKEKVNLADYSGDIIKALQSGGILLTTHADGKTNTMTIGWATFGVNWAKPVFVTYVRESRYTRTLLEKNPEFTINVPLGAFDKKILGVCGSKSGRDMDKIAELGLTEVAPEHISVPGLKEFPLTLECKVIYTQEQDCSFMTMDLEDIEHMYPSGHRDEHTTFYGEIVAAYIIKD